MSEKKPPEEKEPVIYATPVKRVWAWVGVAYVLFFMATFTYHLATASILVGTGPLLLCPALCGLGATAVLRYRAGACRGGLPACIAVSTLCGFLLGINLFMGVRALLRNFGG